MTVTGDNRILIIKLGALGDVVLATPQRRASVEAYPAAEVTLPGPHPERALRTLAAVLRSAGAGNPAEAQGGAGAP